MMTGLKRMFGILGRVLRFIRNLLGALVTLILLAVLIVSFMSAQPRMPEKAALVIAPKGMLVEEMAVPQPSDLLFGNIRTEQSNIHDLVLALDRAGKDPRIRFVYLDLAQMDAAPPGRFAEIRRALKRFRASGKRIIAYGESYTQSQYYLASPADKIWLHPMGFVALQGLAYRRHYLKQALDRLKVDVHLFRAGRYKSFGEPFVRNSMSAAAREESRSWLNELWRQMLADIATDRGIRPETIEAVIRDPGAHTRKAGSLAEVARELGLVDELLDGETAHHRLAAMLEVPVGGTLPLIEAKAYLRATGGRAKDRPGKSHVAVIVASGPILSGEQPAGSIGSASLAQLIHQAAADAQIKAVVLRLDSPGGSAVASENIRASLLELKKREKPLVVSMGGVAASGGYWIASAADEIWAEPTSLTGSIGVFGLTAGIPRGLESLGVHVDGVSTSEIAGHPRPDLPLPQSMADLFQIGVDTTYRQFLNVVAQGRGMSHREVAAVAEGRVWSGIEAKNRRLIDHLGGLNAAIRAAAKRAGIEQPGIRWLHRPRTPFELLLENFGVETLFASLLPHPGSSVVDLLDSWNQATLLLSRPGIHAWIDLRVE